MPVFAVFPKIQITEMEHSRNLYVFVQRKQQQQQQQQGQGSSDDLPATLDDPDRFEVRKRHFCAILY